MKKDNILELPKTVYKGKDIVSVHDIRFPLAMLICTYKVDDKEFFTVCGAKRYIRKNQKKMLKSC